MPPPVQEQYGRCSCRRCGPMDREIDTRSVDVDAHGAKASVLPAAWTVGKSLITGGLGWRGWTVLGRRNLSLTHRAHDAFLEGTRAWPTMSTTDGLRLTHGRSYNRSARATPG